MRRDRHSEIPVELGSATALITDARALDVILTTKQAEGVLGFGRLLVRWNRRFNLVSRQDVARLRSRHLLDSLSLAPILDAVRQHAGPDSRVLDAGSGAGLPGLPLAIARPQVDFVLAERGSRKARFLNQVINELGLANVTVFAGDARELATGDFQGFGVVTARALAQPDEVWLLARPLLSSAGRLLLMSRTSFVEDDVRTTPLDGAVVEAVQRISVPGLERAHEVMIIRADDKPMHANRSSGAMARVIAVANQKGGVGKTTTSVNLAASLAMSGSRVLLVDLDPQGNATMGSGVDKAGLERSSYDWLISAVPAEQLIERTSGGYELMPSNADLTAAEVELLALEGRENRLAERLAECRDHYHFVIVDCPPSLNILTLNALIAADSVLIPMQCEYYALEGLSALLETVDAVKARTNPALEIEGLLRTMYDPRNSLTRDVSRQLIQFFGDKVFRTVIPRNVRLAEAPSHGLPAILYDRQSRGAVAYLALAGEINRKHDRHNAPPGAG